MTCEESVTQILTTGEFKAMNQLNLPDGACTVTILAKDGKVYQANVSDLYKPTQVINTCTILKE